MAWSVVVVSMMFWLIKDADCGIAMAAGADAAKQAAHIVLLDSNFSSIKSIVKEGRTIIANIERVSSLCCENNLFNILIFVLWFDRTYLSIHCFNFISGFAIGLPSLIIT